MPSTLKIVEGVIGYYNYHLSESGNNYEPALCGKRDVMHSGMRIRDWNMAPTHIRYSFCKTCHRKAVELGICLPAASESTITF
jgi:hypothetical protein